MKIFWVKHRTKNNDLLFREVDKYQWEGADSSSAFYFLQLDKV